jgi:hypothetical protein
MRPDPEGTRCLDDGGHERELNSRASERATRGMGRYIGRAT